MATQNPLAKGRNQKLLALGIGAAIAGALVGFFGLLMIIAKLRIAVIFLGANELFNMPLAQDDAVKVALVGLAGLFLLGIGGFLFIAGVIVALVQFSRKT